MPYRYEIYNDRNFKIAVYHGLSPQMDYEVINGNTYINLGIALVKNEDGHFAHVYEDPLEGYTAAEIEAAEKFDPKRLQEIQAVIRHENPDETLDHND